MIKRAISLLFKYYIEITNDTPICIHVSTILVIILNIPHQNRYHGYVPSLSLFNIVTSSTLSIVCFHRKEITGLPDKKRVIKEDPVQCIYTHNLVNGNGQYPLLPVVVVSIRLVVF